MTNKKLFTFAWFALTLTVCIAIAVGEKWTSRLSEVFTFIACAAGAGSALLGLWAGLKDLDN
jgi:hypothetical protein